MNWITEQIGKPYGPAFPKAVLPKGVCWDFCRDALRQAGKELPPIVDVPGKLERFSTALLMDVVLFRLGGFFHGGIIWPDGLHFVHAIPDECDTQVIFVVRKDRLTAFPWNCCLEGFYRVP